MKNILLLLILSLGLVACGKGDGGFTQADGPKIHIVKKNAVIIPSGERGDFASLSRENYALFTVTVTQGGQLFRGSDDIYVEAMPTGEVENGTIWCFDIQGKGDCIKNKKEDEEDEEKVYKPSSGRAVNLNNGVGTFAVSAPGFKQGRLDIRVSLSGSSSYPATSKLIDLAVRYPSTEGAGSLYLSGKEIMTTGQATTYTVRVSDQDGNPIANPDNNNIVITATGVRGTTLSCDADRSSDKGSSIRCKTTGGVAQFTVSAEQRGNIVLTAWADASDNDVSNGITTLISASKTILVANDKSETTGGSEQTGDIVIISGTLPTGSVGSQYNASIITTGSPAVDFKIPHGDFPPGLNLDASIGKITGKPTRADSYKFTIEATGVNGSQARKDLTLQVVNHALSFDPQDLGTLNLTARQNCLSANKIIEIKSEGGYSPLPSFTWSMIVKDEPIPIDEDKTPLQDSNGTELEGLYLTASGEATKIVMGGQICQTSKVTKNYTYAIKLRVTDSNDVTFESVLPLTINQKEE